MDPSNKEDLISKYKAKLEKEFYGKSIEEKKGISTNYVDFRKELMPDHLTKYEAMCNKSEKILKVVPDESTSKKLQSFIDLCHLQVTPTGTFSFAILVSLAVFVTMTLLGFFLFHTLFFLVYSLPLALILLMALANLPEYFANNWRLKSSNQMVQVIFYIATYMRHTSNLELALVFASDHLSPPLSLDLKKVLWDVETEKYSSVKESLDNYLQTWKDWNPEFIESFNLIEGSLLESSEDKRLSMVDKALDVMLDETYEKMLRYAHDLKGPITMLYMLGIILPVLGLVVLPLVSSFLAGDDPSSASLVIALIYNLTLPLVVYYMGKAVLSKRPTGYGETDISDDNPEIKKYKKVSLKLAGQEFLVNPLFISIFVISVFVFIGLIPLLAQLFLPQSILISDPKPPAFTDMTFQDILRNYFFAYKKVGDNIIGPYGLGAAVFSIFIPLGIGIGIGIYYRMISGKVIQIRTNTKKLENEFASGLFQLGNRLGDGLPAEIAFSKVADVTKDTATGNFFELVSINIRKRGMGLKQAIFDSDKGALVFFPSSIIESTMKVLVESSKKGPMVASRAMINVSEYIKQIHRVDERLKDLLADIISDMKQQTQILAPAISAIVVGITSMIITILVKLGDILSSGCLDQGSGNANTLSAIQNIFKNGIPTFYFQLIVGIYVVEIVYILTILTNGIENGADHLGEEDALGKNMIRSTVIYCVISFIVVLAFNLIAFVILNSGGFGASC